MKMFKEFWEEEDGIATVEILLILAVLIIIAIIFRKAIVDWVKNMVNSLFGNANSEVESGLGEAESFTPAPNTPTP